MIVQDIALLRATNKNILSTNKGYFLYNPGKGPQKPKRSFCVQHTTEQMQDEFMERIRKSKSQPLNVLTGGKHWHTVEADTEPMLQVIGEKLREKGFLQE